MNGNGNHKKKRKRLIYGGIVIGIILLGAVVLYAFTRGGTKIDPSKLAKVENLTIRQLYQHIAGARGHREIYGTPEQIADQLQDWFENGAADGFNIMAPLLPDGLEEFITEVIPILHERGLFRTNYEGRTLRDHLGLKKPNAAEVLQR